MSDDQNNLNGSNEPVQPFADPTQQPEAPAPVPTPAPAPEPQTLVEPQPVQEPVVNETPAGEYTAPGGAIPSPSVNGQTVSSAPTGTMPSGPAKTNGLAIAALVTGIIGLLFGCCTGVIGLPFAIAALVTGILGMKKVDEQTGGKGFAIAGIILGVIGILIGVLSIIFIVAIGAGSFGEIMSELENMNY